MAAQICLTTYRSNGGKKLKHKDFKPQRQADQTALDPAAQVELFKGMVKHTDA